LPLISKKGTALITHIRGDITHKTPTYIVVEAGGIGYHVNISLFTYAKVEKLERVKILTYLHIKEDAHTLYGFAEDEERILFVHLISVSGIGPTTAQMMLSQMNPDEIRAAIIGENEAALRKVKGIGPKAAKQIILDLKSKMMKTGGDVSPSLLPADNTIRQEALSALLALQVNKIQAQKALNKALDEQPGVKTVEDLVRLALKQLS
jgi:Holliday junction DNA helicase RuvA